VGEGGGSKGGSGSGARRVEEVCRKAGAGAVPSGGAGAGVTIQLATYGTFALN
jgi:hypothetical protein